MLCIRLQTALLKQHQLARVLSFYLSKRKQNNRQHLGKFNCTMPRYQKSIRQKTPNQNKQNKHQSSLKGQSKMQTSQKKRNSCFLSSIPPSTKSHLYTSKTFRLLKSCCREICNFMGLRETSSLHYLSLYFQSTAVSLSQVRKKDEDFSSGLRLEIYDLFL